MPPRPERPRVRRNGGSGVDETEPTRNAQRQRSHRHARTARKQQRDFHWRKEAQDWVSLLNERLRGECAKGGASKFGGEAVAARRGHTQEAGEGFGATGVALAPRLVFQALCTYKDEQPHADVRKQQRCS